jgi:hypothetical protein
MKKKFFSKQKSRGFTDTIRATSVEITEGTDTGLAKEASKAQLVYSKLGLILGGGLVIASIIILFTKDYTIENPVINMPFIYISAGKLTLSALFFVAGLIIVYITRYSLKVKQPSSGGKLRGAGR